MTVFRGNCRSRTVIVCLVSLLMLTGSGCSRNFWRTQADFDALTLLEQKQFDSRWDLPRTTVDADPRSRFYDPYDLDFEPLPPDDPAANQYMNWLYGMRGYKSWHRFGASMTVENPQWLEQFGIAPETFHDVYRFSDGLTVIEKPPKSADDCEDMVPTIENLTLAQAIELSSLHSRDYQTQIESLFLSALQLSLAQFQFNVRYLGIGGNTPTGEATYSTTPGGTQSMLFSSQAGISQVLPTGGEWIIGLANNTLWLFSGGRNTSSQSILSYSLVQPLLQGAGRKVILENLTANERNVLYNIRLLARFRKLFFADTVVNTGGGSTSSAAAISATSGSSSVNPTVISTNAGIAVAPGTTVGSSSAASTAPQGYFGMLLQLQRVLNQHQNVEYLRVQTERFRELVAQTPFRRLAPGALPNGIQFPPELDRKIEYSAATRRLRWRDDRVMTAEEREKLLSLSDDAEYIAAIRGLYDQLRVGVTTLDIIQLATNLTSAEVQERALLLAYNDEIDQYKFFLGLPIDMQITIDRSLLKPFELTDPRLIETESRVLALIKETSKISDDDDPALSEMRPLADQFVKLIERVRVDGVDLVEEDFRHVRENTPRRLAQLIGDASRDLVTQALERDAIIFSNVKTDFRELAAVIYDLRRTLVEDDISQMVRAEALGTMKDAREDLMSILQNLRLLQLEQRTELINLEEFHMDIDEVVAIALENRLDLMNASAKVMDARRNMEVAANRLEAVLNVVAQGSLNTPPTGNHPLDFRGANSTFQFGLQMAAPLDQMQVRNVYRGALVSYQQARRAYMLLEDQVKYDVRTSWRQLMANRQNFEASRKNLRQAAIQFDINVSNNLNPAAQAQGAGQAGMTTLSGATGLNLLNATSSLLSAQNNLVQYWLSYERNRINIYRDMDIMQVDERGLWIDPVYQNLGGRGLPSPEEPANDTLPEPSDASSFRIRGNQPTEAGLVRLVRGSSVEPKEVSLEKAGNSAPAPGWLERWRRIRVARASSPSVSGKE